jgi:hypothetical protein
LQHFKEHVIEAIPFHKKLQEQHKKRLNTIKKLIPKRKYNKLVKISMKYGGTPEYFVYDKLNKKYFFVAEHADEARKKWINKTKKLVDVIILDKT